MKIRYLVGELVLDLFPMSTTEGNTTFCLGKLLLSLTDIS